MMSQSPSEFFSLNDIKLILLILGLVEFFLLHLLTGKKTNSGFFFFSGFQSSIDECKNCMEISSKEGGERVDQSMSRNDVEIVLRSLGMLCKNCDELVVSYDVLEIFEERNPSMDEVKEAFDVFDENRDGFIDAYELQKVMCALRLREGSEVEKCETMIKVFDTNGDGRMDFEEFVKFMEISLC